MADQIEVGDLVVRLIADAKQLEAALQKATGYSQKFDREQKKAFSGTKKSAKEAGDSVSGLTSQLGKAAAAYVSVSAAVALFNSSLNQVRALDQLSQATGVSVERLDKLRQTALSLGVEFTTVEAATRGFAQRLAEGLGNSTSPVTLALRAMGVSARDAQGNVKSFADILPELADKFASYRDGVAKAQLAIALFGEEAGPKLLPLLNQGRSGLDQIRKTINDTITPEDVQRARLYYQALGQLQVKWEELARKLSNSEAVRLAFSGITEYIDRVIGSLERLGIIERSQEQKLLIGINTRVREYQSLEEQVRQLQEQVKSSAMGQAEYDNQLAALEPRMKTLRKEVEELTKQYEELKKSQQAATSPSGPGGGTPPPDIGGLREGAMEALKEGQYQLGLLQERLFGTRDILDDLNYRWMSHAEIIAQATEKINAAYDKQGDRRRALATIERQLQKQQQQGMLDTATAAANVITAFWPQQKNAAIAAAVINTAVAVTKAYTSGVPPWNLAQAALVAAAGAAQIAQIRSTSLDGGGGSSSPVATSAPAAPVDTGATATPTRALSIEGIDPAAIFTGRQLEDLISRISTEVQNGAVLVSTRNLPR